MGPGGWTGAPGALIGLMPEQGCPGRHFGQDLNLFCQDLNLFSQDLYLFGKDLYLMAEIGRFTVFPRSEMVRHNSNDLNMFGPDVNLFGPELNLFGPDLYLIGTG